ncbi:MAG: universal stress protein [Pseudomonadota bacterium]
MSKPQHLLVASDGSPDSLKAAALAGELARALGAKVTLLAVQSEDDVLPHAWAAGNYPDETVSDSVPTEDIRKTLKRRVLEVELPHVAEALGQLPIQAELVHRWGHPASEICDYADEQGVDLIVVGSHGRTGIKRVLLGSVSRAVSGSASCSVVIAR